MGISKLRALVQFRLGSHTLPIGRAILPDQPSRATFAGALFAIHRLWAMSSIVCLIAVTSVTSGPIFLACSKMLLGACVCSCGTRTRSLSAIVSLPCCRRLRHEHSPGWLNGRSDSLSLSLSQWQMTPVWICPYSQCWLNGQVEFPL